MIFHSRDTRIDEALIPNDEYMILSYRKMYDKLYIYSFWAQFDENDPKR